MTDFFRKYSHSWFVIASLLAIAAIILCNLWALMVGHCAIHDFLRIPTIGWFLILGNVLAGLTLYFVKHRNRSKPDGSYCSNCYVYLRDSWDYCPNCGDEVAPGLHSNSAL